MKKPTSPVWNFTFSLLIGIYLPRGQVRRQWAEGEMVVVLAQD